MFIKGAQEYPQFCRGSREAPLCYESILSDTSNALDPEGYFNLDDESLKQGYSYTGYRAYFSDILYSRSSRFYIFIEKYLHSSKGFIVDSIIFVSS